MCVPAFSPLELVQRQIDRYSCEISPDAGLASKFIQRLVELDECFLSHIVCFRTVSQHADHGCRHSVFILFHKFFESVLIPVLCLSDQFLFVRFHFHDFRLASIHPIRQRKSKFYSPLSSLPFHLQVVLSPHGDIRMHVQLEHFRFVSNNHGC